MFLEGVTIHKESLSATSLPLFCRPRLPAPPPRGSRASPTSPRSLTDRARLQPRPVGAARVPAGCAGVCLVSPCPGRDTALTAAPVCRGPALLLVIDVTRPASQVRDSVFSTRTQTPASRHSCIRSRRLYIFIWGPSKYGKAIKNSKWNRHWNPLLIPTPCLTCVLTPVTSAGVKAEEVLVCFYEPAAFFTTLFIVRQMNSRSFVNVLCLFVCFPEAAKLFKSRWLGFVFSQIGREITFWKVIVWPFHKTYLEVSYFLSIINY